MTAEEQMELLRVVAMLLNKQGWKHNASSLDTIRLRIADDVAKLKAKTVAQQERDRGISGECPTRDTICPACSIPLSLWRSPV